MNNEDKIAGEREEREQETKLKRKNEAGQERENDVVNGVINGGREREREGVFGREEQFRLCLEEKPFKNPPNPYAKAAKSLSLLLFCFVFSFFLLNFF